MNNFKSRAKKRVEARLEQYSSISDRLSSDITDAANHIYRLHTNMASTTDEYLQTCHSYVESISKKIEEEKSLRQGSKTKKSIYSQEKAIEKEVSGVDNLVKILNRLDIENDKLKSNTANTVRLLITVSRTVGRIRTIPGASGILGKIIDFLDKLMVQQDYFNIGGDKKKGYLSEIRDSSLNALDRIYEKNRKEAKLTPADFLRKKHRQDVDEKTRKTEIQIKDLVYNEHFSEEDLYDLHRLVSDEEGLGITINTWKEFLESLQIVDEDLVPRLEPYERDFEGRILKASLDQRYLFGQAKRRNIEDDDRQSAPIEESDSEEDLQIDMDPLGDSYEQFFKDAQEAIMDLTQNYYSQIAELQKEATSFTVDTFSNEGVIKTQANELYNWLLKKNKDLTDTDKEKLREDRENRDKEIKEIEEENKRRQQSGESQLKVPPRLSETQGTGDEALYAPHLAVMKKLFGMPDEDVLSSGAVFELGAMKTPVDQLRYRTLCLSEAGDFLKLIQRKADKKEQSSLNEEEEITSEPEEPYLDLLQDEDEIGRVLKAAAPQIINAKEEIGNDPNKIEEVFELLKEQFSIKQEGRNKRKKLIASREQVEATQASLIDSISKFKGLIEFLYTKYPVEEVNNNVAVQELFSEVASKRSLWKRALEGIQTREIDLVAFIQKAREAMSNELVSLSEATGDQAEAFYVQFQDFFDSLQESLDRSNLKEIKDIDSFVNSQQELFDEIIDDTLEVASIDNNGFSINSYPNVLKFKEELEKLKEVIKSNQLQIEASIFNNNKIRRQIRILSRGRI